MSQNRPGRRRNLALSLGGVAAGLAALGGVSAPDVVPKNFGVVEEGKVYRSGQMTPGAFDRARAKYGLRTVVDLGSYEPDERGEVRNQRVAAAAGVERHVFDLEGDARGNPNSYVRALRIMMDPAKQPVLVHCGAGSERTSCVMILYEHLTRGVPIEEGLKGARRFKHDDRRNPHLREVLEDWAEPIVRAVREGSQIEVPEPRPR